MRKSFILLLLSSLSLSVFTGCGGDSSNESASSSNASSENNSSSGEVDTITFPLSKAEELTFHYHARDKYVFNEEWPVFQKMAEITNVTLKNTANEVATNSVEQFQLQAVDRFPSDIYGGNNIIPFVLQYGPDGAFVPLNEHWDVLPHFSAYLEDNPDVKAAITAYDGNIYHIPYIQEGSVARTYFIRTDWIEKLGLEIPKTTEDVEKILLAFKENDPNGNGINDEIPYFNDKWQEMIRLVNLWDSRAYGMDDYDERVIPKEDGTVYNAWTQPEFKEAIKNISRWYDLGLIDKEVFTKGSSSRKEYLPKNLGGMTHEWTASTSAYNSQVDIEGFKFEIIEPPMTAGGNQWEEHSRLKVKPDGWAVSSSCENPEIALAYMDYFYSEEGRILSNFGIEGETYTMVDGKPKFTDEVLNGDKAVNTLLESEVGAQLKHGYWMDYDYEYQWTNEVGRAGVDLYSAKDFSVVQMPSLSFNTEEKDTIDNKLANLNSYMNETVQRWVMNDPSMVDDEWDDYLSELDKLGLQEILGAYQSAYTRFLEILGS